MVFISVVRRHFIDFFSWWIFFFIFTAFYYVLLFHYKTIHHHVGMYSTYIRQQEEMR